MRTVTVGMVGAGYAGFLHGNGYKNISKVNLKLKTVVDIIEPRAKDTAAKFGFASYGTDYKTLLADPEIDIIDIVTPPNIHPQIAYEALQAGKHVICEKPFTGYFGRPGDPAPIGDKVPKTKMFEVIKKELAEGKKIVEAAKTHFMYAENWVYAPNVRKTAEFITKKNSRILFMKGESYLRGSSSAVASDWNQTGGGPLIRNAVHPLSCMLWMKREEGKARGEEIKVKSVTADWGRIAPTLTKEQRRHFNANPVDVEDNITVTMTFSDGTMGVIIGSDTVLGGSTHNVEFFANDGTYRCNVAPTDYLQTYFLDEKGIEDIYLAEMIPNKLGWYRSFVSDEVLRGYAGEFQDFVECVAFNRKPVSDYDLAAETVKVIYAAYVAAEEGRKVTL